MADAVPLVSLAERDWAAVKVDAKTAAEWPLGDAIQPDPAMASHLGSRPTYELKTAEIGAVVLRGELPEAIRITDTTLADIVAAGSGDVALFISDAGTVTLAAIEAADGTVSFAGGCNDSLDGQLSSFRSSHSAHDRASGIQVVVNLFGNENGARDDMIAHVALPAPTPWSERDPATRIIDPEEVPPDVFSGLTLVTFAVAPNAEWAQIEGTICTRIRSVGWNECIRTSALASPTDVEMTGTALAGEDLELWLLDSQGNVAEPIAFLGVIAAEDAIVSDAGQTRISFSAGVTTIEDVITQEGSLVVVGSA